MEKNRIYFLILISCFVTSTSLLITQETNFSECSNLINGEIQNNFCEKYDTILNCENTDDTENRIIIEDTTSSPIYDESMMNFHKIFDCHSLTMGLGTTILVIDTPVDHRHKIFEQEDFDSLDSADCYEIEFDYSTGEMKEVINEEPIYTGNFASNFNLSTNIFLPSYLNHGTQVAGLIKQVAPKARIISMGVEATLSGPSIAGHIKALEWALNYIQDGNTIDVITISSYGDSPDSGDISDFLGLVNFLAVTEEVIFTFSTDNSNIDLSDDLMYAAMGNFNGTIGVGRIYDTDNPANTGKRGGGGYNGDTNNLDLEIMATGFNIKTSHCCNVTEGDLEHLVSYENQGTSYSTPIVAGAIALAKSTGWSELKIENIAKNLAIPAKTYDPGHDDSYYEKYYGYGILNIAGLLGVSDFDNDGLSDIDEYEGTYGYETLPFEKFTDDDYIGDGQEVLTFGTNPLAEDSDSDGLMDHSEVWTYLTNPNDADSDHDGLFDYEEINDYYTNPNDKTTDGDLWEDGYEVHTTGTDPLMSDSDLDGLIDHEEFSYWRSLGFSYQDSWDNCIDSDVDSDGLTDGYEKNHGLKPYDSDTDNDTMPDGYEVEHGLNPLSNDRYLDKDSDGLTNYYEFQIGTDPDDYDTDNDGYSDGEEIAAGTDPRDDDSYPGGGFGWG